MAAKTLVYEVTLDVRPDVGEDFDAWLREHVEEMLSLPGFLSASIEHPEDAEDAGLEREEVSGSEEEPAAAWLRRVVRYRMRDRASLDRYLEEHAPRMRQQAVDRFGDRFTASRRIRTTRPEETRGALLVPKLGYKRCANCGAELIGKFCANCGQRDRQRLPTVFEMMGEFLGDVFEYDSRLWRSVGPLLFRPGLLTREYIQGRRVRFLPPVRMYLVVSILFFLLVSLGTDLEVSVAPAPDQQGTAAERGDTVSGASPWYDEHLDPDTPAPQEPGEGMKKARGEIPLDPEAMEALRERAEARAAAEARESAEGESGTGAAGTSSADRDGSEATDDGPRVELPETGLFDTEALERRLESQARKIKGPEGGKALAKVMLENLPTMLFVFLPVVALVLRMLYPLSGRIYVEHLIFTLHYHSFFFLELIITISLFRLADWWSPLEVIGGVLAAIVSIWTPIYLFMAMRRVYGQGFLATLFKYILLSIAYLVSLLITVALTAMISLLSI